MMPGVYQNTTGSVVLLHTSVDSSKQHPDDSSTKQPDDSLTKQPDDSSKQQPKESQQTGDVQDKAALNVPEQTVEPTQ